MGWLDKGQKARLRAFHNRIVVLVRLKYRMSRWAWRQYRHPFRRFQLRGRYVTWCLSVPGWFRVGQIIFRWEKQ